MLYNLWIKRVCSGRAADENHLNMSGRCLLQTVNEFRRLNAADLHLVDANKLPPHLMHMFVYAQISTTFLPACYIIVVYASLKPWPLRPQPYDQIYNTLVKHYAAI